MIFVGLLKTAKFLVALTILICNRCALTPYDQNEMSSAQPSPHFHYDIHEFLCQYCFTLKD